MARPVVVPQVPADLRVQVDLLAQVRRVEPEAAVLLARVHQGVRAAVVVLPLRLAQVRFPQAGGQCPASRH